MVIGYKLGKESTSKFAQDVVLIRTTFPVPIVDTSGTAASAGMSTIITTGMAPRIITMSSRYARRATAGAHSSAVK